MQSKVITHGKVILIGEHSVVYGFLALALPTPSIQIETVLTEIATPDNQLVTSDYDGPLESAPANYGGIVFAATELVHKFQIDQKFSLTFNGEIPEERGLGSSAAVALGTIKVLQKHFNLHLTNDEITSLANAAETINHGSASGLDVATVSSNHLISFTKQSGLTQVREKLGAYLVIADSGELGNTKQAVAQVRGQLRENPARSNGLAQLNHYAELTLQSFTQHDSVLLGEQMNAAQRVLHGFDLSTAKIDALIDEALANGALGSKISGGGLGGIVISLAADQAVAEQIKLAQNKIAKNIWIEEI